TVTWPSSVVTTPAFVGWANAGDGNNAMSEIGAAARRAIFNMLRSGPENSGRQTGTARVAEWPRSLPTRDHASIVIVHITTSGEAVQTHRVRSAFGALPRTTLYHSGTVTR